MAITEDIAEYVNKFCRDRRVKADQTRSLTLEDIPVKLRCASCNKLAQDAVRLPCCDQNICSDCEKNLLHMDEIFTNST